MAVSFTYPGVYIEEVPSTVHTIMGVATSTAAFVGRALQGQLDEPVLIHSFADFERTFGGLWSRSPLSYAVSQYFLNGGRDAVIVRVAHDDALAAQISLPGPASTDPQLVISASSPGAWGNRLHVAIDQKTRDLRTLEDGTTENRATLFNISVRLTGAADPTKDILVEEVFRNVSTSSDDARYVSKVLEADSRLIRAQTVPVTGVAATTGWVDVDSAARGTEGTDITEGDVLGSENAKTGIHALLKADIFNLLCLPPRTFDESGETTVSTWQQAAAFCKAHRAILLVDPPSDVDRTEIGDWASGTLGLGDDGTNAALYFPWIRIADPLKENRSLDFPPSGAVAGIIARTDGARGVWKAPAGLDASVSGIRELATKLTDAEHGELNPLGINVIRSFPVTGTVVWGARTLRGADQLASEWKYLQVRRLALFIEETLYRGTQWAVFEPNAEPLWAQIRLNVGAFMSSLFRQGAFQGAAPKDAYVVQCDSSTTTQDDINRGIVNIIVAFAPLKPAEFIVIRISQLAGQVQS